MASETSILNPCIDTDANTMYADSRSNESRHAFEMQMPGNATCQPLEDDAAIPISASLLRLPAKENVVMCRLASYNAMETSCTIRADRGLMLPAGSSGSCSEGPCALDPSE